MPINYSLYPKNWKTKIRPDILKRAKDACEFCLVPNYELILRGKRKVTEAGRKEPFLLDVYQDMDGNIYSAEDGQKIGADYLGELEDCPPMKQMIKVVLTVMQLLKVEVMVVLV